MSLLNDTEYSKFINDKELFKKPLPIFFDDLKEFFDQNTMMYDLCEIELLRKIFDEMKKRSYPIRTNPSLIPLLDDFGNVIFTDPNSKFHEYIIKKIKEKLVRKDDIIEILKTNKKAIIQKHEPTSLSDWKDNNRFIR